MKLNMDDLREIVADLVSEELDRRIDEAVSRKMRSLAVSLIAEARVANAATTQQRPIVTESQARPERRPADAISFKRKVATNIFEDVLQDTQRTTLPAQEHAEKRRDALPQVVEQAGDLLEKLAFSAPLPTRSSVVPKPDA